MSSPSTTVPEGFIPPHPDTVAAPGEGDGHPGTCVGCGQTDDHPHHRMDVGGGVEVVWHNDCHARANPPCPLCAAVTDSHGATLTGEELRAHILATDPAGPVAEALAAEAIATIQAEQEAN